MIWPWSKKGAFQSRPKTIDEIVGPIDRGPPATPGTGGREAKVRYVSFAVSEEPQDLFDEAVWKINPPLVTHGGASLANTVVTIPDGTSFFAIEVNGEPTEWQAQIEQGALAMGRLSARVSDRDFLISDGQAFPLTECRIEHKQLTHRRQRRRS